MTEEDLWGCKHLAIDKVCLPVLAKTKQKIKESKNFLCSEKKPLLVVHGKQNFPSLAEFCSYTAIHISWILTGFLSKYMAYKLQHSKLSENTRFYSEPHKQ